MSTTDNKSSAPAPAPDESGGPGDETALALGETGGALSTAPQEESAGAPAVAGVLGWIRWTWHQLTSMRVALILLLLLSLGSIPGSLVPQTNVDELKVADWKLTHEFWVPLFEKLQLFDVYSSVWFSSIYILLFVSLIGCIVPRTWKFVGQLRGRPVRTPRRLDRLPAYTTWRTHSAPDEVLGAARELLGGRRFRVDDDRDSVVSEKGYLREAGNLVFHLALIVMLVAFAAGQLYKSEGGKLVLRGTGFANTMTQYDDFRSGSLFDRDDLVPFSFTLDKFDATYERTGPQKGTPRTFKAHVTYSEGAYGKATKGAIEVNKPLDIDGSKIYLLGHGYAPILKVTDPRGKVVFNEPVPLLPMDSNITSTGAVKVLDGYRDKDGKKEQLGFQAFFVPTFAGAGKGQMFSQFPALDYPVLALNAYHGSLGMNSGLPQNVYRLDKTKMKEFKDKDGQLFKQRLRPGETMTLPNGAGTVKFEGVERWATFQISHQPANGLALGGAAAAVLGLAGSLFIQRRRVWVRAVTGPDGATVVEMAGLGRSESAKLPEELADLAAALSARAPIAPPGDLDPSAPESPAAPAESPAEGEGERG